MEPCIAPSDSSSQFSVRKAALHAVCHGLAAGQSGRGVQACWHANVLFLAFISQCAAGGGPHTAMLQPQALARCHFQTLIFMFDRVFELV